MAAGGTYSFDPDVQQQVILYCAVSNPFCKANREIVGTDPLALEKWSWKDRKGCVCGGG